ncbi:hypothetical protein KXD40_007681 [Peronospora effusa]|uniref:Uncharacterized protein n=1 Tax=Peronospora effusa TaxID=542832 RepID=A0A3M6VC99_9STRA|nr:hypothetical protein DD238_005392 [Peronospora effusa]RQM13771.1 hypothetical protein DD237_006070 [Peronospora effusa]UIZ23351.1 hypothetical protein KXD40_007681 [Peronospora effusa]
MLGLVTLDENFRMKARHEVEQQVSGLEGHYAADENPWKILAAAHPTGDTLLREAGELDQL